MMRRDDRALWVVGTLLSACDFTSAFRAACWAPRWTGRCSAERHPFQGATGTLARTPGFAVARGSRNPRLTPGNCRWSLGSAELQEFG